MNDATPTEIRLPVVLVHGGLYEDMTAKEFWVDTGVLPAVAARDVDVVAEDRPRTPDDWADERDALAAVVERVEVGRAVVVAASNGCSAALRLAVDRPDLVARLVLGWPATAGDEVADELVRAAAAELGHEAGVADLVAGETVRGVTDDEIARIGVDVVVWPTFPENQFHRASTSTRLLELAQRPIVIGGSPPPMAPGFDAFVEPFADLVAEAALFDEDDLAAE